MSEEWRNQLDEDMRGIVALVERRALAEGTADLTPIILNTITTWRWQRLVERLIVLLDKQTTGEVSE